MFRDIKLKSTVPLNQFLSTPQGQFRAGNQEAVKERLTPEAHAKRMQALFRGWGTKVRQHRGEQFVSKNKKRLEEKRQRIRLYTTVAREAREIQEKARKATDKIMDRMVEIAATSLNETAAIAAANLVYDRAYGKANQTTINANLDANGKATDVSGKELDTRITQALKRVEELTGRAPKAAPSKDQPVDVCKLDRDPDSPTQH